MNWDKKKYFIKIINSRGAVNTLPIKGRVEHLIVVPKKEETVWDLVIFDKEGDEIFEVKRHQGRLDDKLGLPVGGAAQEILTIQFLNVLGKSEVFKIIFKVKDI